MGGGKTTIQTASQPYRSSAEAVREWARVLPQIYETQLKYAPLEAQQEVELAQKFALPLGQAFQQAQAAMYPETAKLQEALAAQAISGMGAEPPDWYKRQWSDYFKSVIGENLPSGIGASTYATSMMEQIKNWQDYYRNLALSVAGRQPLAQPTMPSYTPYMQTFTPTDILNYYKGYGTTTQVQKTPFNWAGVLGQGVGGLLGGLGFGLANRRKNE